MEIYFEGKRKFKKKYFYDLFKNRKFTVYAVIESPRLYLINTNRYLEWMNASMFSVIDPTIPANWIEVKYRRWHQLRNSKFNFFFRLNRYLGPKEFLDDPDFMFNVVEYNDKAYELFLAVYPNESSE